MEEAKNTENGPIPNIEDSPNTPTKACALCGCSTPAVRCDRCSSQIFCLSCDDMYHRHPKRRLHLRKAVDSIWNSSKSPKLRRRTELPGDPSKIPIPPPRSKKREHHTIAGRMFLRPGLELGSFGQSKMFDIKNLSPHKDVYSKPKVPPKTEEGTYENETVLPEKQSANVLKREEIYENDSVINQNESMEITAGTDQNPWNPNVSPIQVSIPSSTPESVPNGQSHGFMPKTQSRSITDLNAAAMSPGGQHAFHLPHPYPYMHPPFQPPYSHSMAHLNCSQCLSSSWSNLMSPHPSPYFHPMPWGPPHPSLGRNEVPSVGPQGPLKHSHGDLVTYPDQNFHYPYPGSVYYPNGYPIPDPNSIKNVPQHTSSIVRRSPSTSRSPRQAQSTEDIQSTADNQPESNANKSNGIPNNGPTNKDKQTEMTDEPKVPVPPSEPWSCLHCTYINPPGIYICQVCCKTSYGNKPSSEADETRLDSPMLDDRNSESPMELVNRDAEIMSSEFSKLKAQKVEDEICQDSLETSMENEVFKSILDESGAITPDSAIMLTTETQTSTTTKSTDVQTQNLVCKSMASSTDSIFPKQEMSVQTEVLELPKHCSVATDPMISSQSIESLMSGMSAPPYHNRRAGGWGRGTSFSTQSLYERGRSRSPLPRSASLYNESHSLGRDSSLPPEEILHGWNPAWLMTDPMYYKPHNLPEYGQTFTKEDYFDGTWGSMDKLNRRVKSKQAKKQDVHHKPKYHRSLDDLKTDKNQEIVHARELQFLQTVKEAERCGFSLEDLHVAYLHCGRENPVLWLEDNWSSMVKNVIALAAKYGEDNEENDVGVISASEAKESLHIHRGDIWDAVTECIENRQRKILELTVRGNFTQKQISDALTHNDGNVELAYADLFRASNKRHKFILSPGLSEDSEDLNLSLQMDESGEISASKRAKLNASPDPKTEKKKSDFLTKLTAIRQAQSERRKAREEKELVREIAVQDFPVETSLSPLEPSNMAVGVSQSPETGEISEEGIAEGSSPTQALLEPDSIKEKGNERETSDKNETHVEKNEHEGLPEVYDASWVDSQGEWIEEFSDEQWDEEGDGQWVTLQKKFHNMEKELAEEAMQMAALWEKEELEDDVFEEEEPESVIEVQQKESDRMKSEQDEKFEQWVKVNLEKNLSETEEAAASDKNLKLEINADIMSKSFETENSVICKSPLQHYPTEFDLSSKSLTEPDWIEVETNVNDPAKLETEETLEKKTADHHYESMEMQDFPLVTEMEKQNLSEPDNSDAEWEKIELEDVQQLHKKEEFPELKKELPEKRSLESLIVESSNREVTNMKQSNISDSVFEDLPQEKLIESIPVKEEKNEQNSSAEVSPPPKPPTRRKSKLNASEIEEVLKNQTNIGDIQSDISDVPPALPLKMKDKISEQVVTSDIYAIPDKLNKAKAIESNQFSTLQGESSDIISAEVSKENLMCSEIAPAKPPRLNIPPSAPEFSKEPSPVTSLSNESDSNCFADSESDPEIKIVRQKMHRKYSRHETEGETQFEEFEISNVETSNKQQSYAREDDFGPELPIPLGSRGIRVSEDISSPKAFREGTARPLQLFKAPKTDATLVNSPSTSKANESSSFDETAKNSNFNEASNIEKADFTSLFELNMPSSSAIIPLESTQISYNNSYYNTNFNERNDQYEMQKSLDTIEIMQQHMKEVESKENQDFSYYNIDVEEKEMKLPPKETNFMDDSSKKPFEELQYSDSIKLPSSPESIQNVETNVCDQKDEELLFTEMEATSAAADYFFGRYNEITVTRPKKKTIVVVGKSGMPAMPKPTSVSQLKTKEPSKSSAMGKSASPVLVTSSEKEVSSEQKVPSTPSKSISVELETYQASDAKQQSVDGESAQAANKILPVVTGKKDISVSPTTQESHVETLSFAEDYFFGSYNEVSPQKKSKSKPVIVKSKQQQLSLTKEQMQQYIQNNSSSMSFYSERENTDQITALMIGSMPSISEECDMQETSIQNLSVSMAAGSHQETDFDDTVSDKMKTVHFEEFPTSIAPPPRKNRGQSKNDRESKEPQKTVKSFESPSVINTQPSVLDKKKLQPSSGDFKIFQEHDPTENPCETPFRPTEVPESLSSSEISFQFPEELKNAPDLNLTDDENYQRECVPFQDFSLIPEACEVLSSSKLNETADRNSVKNPCLPTTNEIELLPLADSLPLDLDITNPEPPAIDYKLDSAYFEDHSESNTYLLENIKNNETEKKCDPNKLGKSTSLSSFHDSFDDGGFQLVVQNQNILNDFCDLYLQENFDVTSSNELESYNVKNNNQETTYDSEHEWKLTEERINSLNASFIENPLFESSDKPHNLDPTEDNKLIISKNEIISEEIETVTPLPIQIVTQFDKNSFNQDIASTIDSTSSKVEQKETSDSDRQMNVENIDICNYEPLSLKELCTTNIISNEIDSSSSSVFKQSSEPSQTTEIQNQAETRYDEADALSEDKIHPSKIQPLAILCQSVAQSLESTSNSYNLLLEEACKSYIQDFFEPQVKACSETLGDNLISSTNEFPSTTNKNSLDLEFYADEKFCVENSTDNVKVTKKSDLKSESLSNKESFQIFSDNELLDSTISFDFGEIDDSTKYLKETFLLKESDDSSVEKSVEISVLTTDNIEDTGISKEENLTKENIQVGYYNKFDLEKAEDNYELSEVVHMSNEFDDTDVKISMDKQTFFSTDNAKITDSKNNVMQESDQSTTDSNMYDLEESEDNIKFLEEVTIPEESQVLSVEKTVEKQPNMTSLTIDHAEETETLVSAVSDSCQITDKDIPLLEVAEEPNLMSHFYDEWFEYVRHNEVAEKTNLLSVYASYSPSESSATTSGNASDIEDFVEVCKEDFVEIKSADFAVTPPSSLSKENDLKNELETCTVESKTSEKVFTLVDSESKSFVENEVFKEKIESFECQTTFHQENENKDNDTRESSEEIHFKTSLSSTEGIEEVDINEMIVNGNLDVASPDEKLYRTSKSCQTEDSFEEEDQFFDSFDDTFTIPCFLNVPFNKISAEQPEKTEIGVQCSLIDDISLLLNINSKNFPSNYASKQDTSSSRVPENIFVDDVFEDDSEMHSVASTLQNEIKSNFSNDVKDASSSDSNEDSDSDLYLESYSSHDEFDSENKSKKTLRCSLYADIDSDTGFSSGSDTGKHIALKDKRVPERKKLFAVKSSSIESSGLCDVTTHDSHVFALEVQNSDESSNTGSFGDDNVKSDSVESVKLRSDLEPAMAICSEEAVQKDSDDNVNENYITDIVFTPVSETIPHSHISADNAFANTVSESSTKSFTESYASGESTIVATTFETKDETLPENLILVETPSNNISFEFKEKLLTESKMFETTVSPNSTSERHSSTLNAKEEETALENANVEKSDLVSLSFVNSTEEKDSNTVESSLLLEDNKLKSELSSSKIKEKENTFNNSDDEESQENIRLDSTAINELKYVSECSESETLLSDTLTSSSETVSETLTIKESSVSLRYKREENLDLPAAFNKSSLIEDKSDLRSFDSGSISKEDEYSEENEDDSLNSEKIIERAVTPISIQQIPTYEYDLKFVDVEDEAEEMIIYNIEKPTVPTVEYFYGPLPLSVENELAQKSKESFYEALEILDECVSDLENNILENQSLYEIPKRQQSKFDWESFKRESTDNYSDAPSTLNNNDDDFNSDSVSEYFVMPELEFEKSSPQCIVTTESKSSATSIDNQDDDNFVLSSEIIIDENILSEKRIMDFPVLEKLQDEKNVHPSSANITSQSSGSSADNVEEMNRSKDVKQDTLSVEDIVSPCPPDKQKFNTVELSQGDTLVSDRNIERESNFENKVLQYDSSAEPINTTQNLLKTAENTKENLLVITNAESLKTLCETKILNRMETPNIEPEGKLSASIESSEISEDLKSVSDYQSSQSAINTNSEAIPQVPSDIVRYLYYDDSIQFEEESKSSEIDSFQEFSCIAEKDIAEVLEAKPSLSPVEVVESFQTDDHSKSNKISTANLSNLLDTSDLKLRVLEKKSSTESLEEIEKSDFAIVEDASEVIEESENSDHFMDLSKTNASLQNSQSDFESIQQSEEVKPKSTAVEDEGMPGDQMLMLKQETINNALGSKVDSDEVTDISTHFTMTDDSDKLSDIESDISLTDDTCYFDLEDQVIHCEAPVNESKNYSDLESTKFQFSSKEEKKQEISNTISKELVVAQTIDVNGNLTTGAVDSKSLPETGVLNFTYTEIKADEVEKVQEQLSFVAEVVPTEPVIESTQADVSVSEKSLVSELEASEYYVPSEIILSENDDSLFQDISCSAMEESFTETDQNEDFVMPLDFIEPKPNCISTSTSFINQNKSANFTDPTALDFISNKENDDNKNIYLDTEGITLSEFIVSAEDVANKAMIVKQEKNTDVLEEKEDEKCVEYLPSMSDVMQVESISNSSEEKEISSTLVSKDNLHVSEEFKSETEVVEKQSVDLDLDSVLNVRSESCQKEESPLSLVVEEISPETDCVEVFAGKNILKKEIDDIKGDSSSFSLSNAHSSIKFEQESVSDIKCLREVESEINKQSYLVDLEEYSATKNSQNSVGDRSLKKIELSSSSDLEVQSNFQVEENVNSEPCLRDTADKAFHIPESNKINLKEAEKAILDAPVDAEIAKEICSSFDFKGVPVNKKSGVKDTDISTVENIFISETDNVNSVKDFKKQPLCEEKSKGDEKNVVVDFKGQPLIDASEVDFPEPLFDKVKDSEIREGNNTVVDFKRQSHIDASGSDYPETSFDKNRSSEITEKIISTIVHSPEEKIVKQIDISNVTNVSDDILVVDFKGCLKFPEKFESESSNCKAEHSQDSLTTLDINPSADFQYFSHDGKKFRTSSDEIDLNYNIHQQIADNICPTVDFKEKLLSDENKPAKINQPADNQLKQKKNEDYSCIDFKEQSTETSTFVNEIVGTQSVNSTNLLIDETKSFVNFKGSLVDDNIFVDELSNTKLEDSSNLQISEEINLTVDFKRNIDSMGNLVSSENFESKLDSKVIDELVSDTESKTVDSYLRKSEIKSIDAFPSKKSVLPAEGIEKTSELASTEINNDVSYASDIENSFVSCIETESSFYHSAREYDDDTLNMTSDDDFTDVPSHATLTEDTDNWTDVEADGEFDAFPFTKESTPTRNVSTVEGKFINYTNSDSQNIVTSDKNSQYYHQQINEVQFCYDENSSLFQTSREEKNKSDVTDSDKMDELSAPNSDIQIENDGTIFGTEKCSEIMPHAEQNNFDSYVSIFEEYVEATSGECEILSDLEVTSPLDESVPVNVSDYQTLSILNFNELNCKNISLQQLNEETLDEISAVEEKTGTKSDEFEEKVETIKPDLETEGKMLMTCTEDNKLIPFDIRLESSENFFVEVDIPVNNLQCDSKTSEDLVADNLADLTTYDSVTDDCEKWSDSEATSSLGEYLLSEKLYSADDRKAKGNVSDKPTISNNIVAGKGNSVEVERDALETPISIVETHEDSSFKNDTLEEKSPFLRLDLNEEIVKDHCQSMFPEKENSLSVSEQKSIALNECSGPSFENVSEQKIISSDLQTETSNVTSEKVRTEETNISVDSLPHDYSEATSYGSITDECEKCSFSEASALDDSISQSNIEMDLKISAITFDNEDVIVKADTVSEFQTNNFTETISEKEEIPELKSKDTDINFENKKLKNVILESNENIIATSESKILPKDNCALDMDDSLALTSDDAFTDATSAHTRSDECETWSEGEESISLEDFLSASRETIQQTEILDTEECLKSSKEDNQKTENLTNDIATINVLSSPNETDMVQLIAAHPKTFKNLNEIEIAENEFFEKTEKLLRKDDNFEERSVLLQTDNLKTTEKINELSPMQEDNIFFEHSAIESVKPPEKLIETELLLTEHFAEIQSLSDYLNVVESFATIDEDLAVPKIHEENTEASLRLEKTEESEYWMEADTEYSISEFEDEAVSLSCQEKAGQTSSSLMSAFDLLDDDKKAFAGSNNSSENTTEISVSSFFTDPEQSGNVSDTCADISLQGATTENSDKWSDIEGDGLIDEALYGPDQALDMNEKYFAPENNKISKEEQNVPLETCILPHDTGIQHSDSLNDILESKEDAHKKTESNIQESSSVIAYSVEPATPTDSCTDIPNLNKPASDKNATLQRDKASLLSEISALSVSGISDEEFTNVTPLDVTVEESDKWSDISDTSIEEDTASFPTKGRDDSNLVQGNSFCSLKTENSVSTLPVETLSCAEDSESFVSAVHDNIIENINENEAGKILIKNDTEESERKESASEDICSSETVAYAGAKIISSPQDANKLNKKDLVDDTLKEIPIQEEEIKSISPSSDDYIPEETYEGLDDEEFNEITEEYDIPYEGDDIELDENGYPTINTPYLINDDELLYPLQYPDWIEESFDLKEYGIETVLSGSESDIHGYGFHEEFDDIERAIDLNISNFDEALDGIMEDDRNLNTESFKTLSNGTSSHLRPNEQEHDSWSTADAVSIEEDLPEHDDVLSRIDELLAEDFKDFNDGYREDEGCEEQDRLELSPLEEFDKRDALCERNLFQIEEDDTEAEVCNADSFARKEAIEEKHDYKKDILKKKNQNSFNDEENLTILSIGLTEDNHDKKDTEKEIVKTASNSEPAEDRMRDDLRKSKSKKDGDEADLSSKKLSEKDKENINLVSSTNKNELSFNIPSSKTEEQTLKSSERDIAVSLLDDCQTDSKLFRKEIDEESNSSNQNVIIKMNNSASDVPEKEPHKKSKSLSDSVNNKIIDCHETSDTLSQDKKVVSFSEKVSVEIEEKLSLTSSIDGSEHALNIPIHSTDISKNSENNSDMSIQKIQKGELEETSSNNIQINQDKDVKELLRSEVNTASCEDTAKPDIPSKQKFKRTGKTAESLSKNKSLDKSVSDEGNKDIEKNKSKKEIFSIVDNAASVTKADIPKEIDDKVLSKSSVEEVPVLPRKRRRDVASAESKSASSSTESLSSGDSYMSKPDSSRDENTNVSGSIPDVPVRRRRSVQSPSAQLRRKSSSDSSSSSVSKSSVHSKSSPGPDVTRKRLSIDERIAKLQNEGKCSNKETAFIAAKLIEMQFEEEDALLASKQCSSVYHAVKFLTQLCELCNCRFPINLMVSMVHCTHRACKDCVKAHFTTIIYDRSIFSLLCPICHMPDITDQNIQEYFNHLDIMLRNVLDSHVYDLFQRKLRDEVLTKDPNFHWCSQCSSGFIASPRLKKLYCPDCSAITCASCHQTWELEHEGVHCERFQQWKDMHTPEPPPAGLVKYLTDRGITCPSCGLLYAQACGGCLLYKCSHCSDEFCGFCSQELKRAKGCLNRNCISRGKHVHHLLNCLFYIRDKEISDIQMLLEEESVEYLTIPPKDQIVKSRCQVREQKHIHGSISEDRCGRDIVPYCAGLCRTHYYEYLAELLRKKKISPLSIMTTQDLQLMLRKARVNVPEKVKGETNEEYYYRLTKVVSSSLN